jgi:hypothetical protein
MSRATPLAKLGLQLRIAEALKNRFRTTSSRRCRSASGASAPGVPSTQ